MRLPGARARVRLPAWSLRTRVTTAFALGSLVLVGVLGLVTYFVAQHYLVQARERSLLRQTYVDARVLRDEMQRQREPRAALAALELGTTSNVVISVDDTWYGTSVSQQGTPRNIPAGLRRDVGRGVAGHQRVELDGHPTLVVGLPLRSIQAQYYETFTLVELDRTLGILRTALAAGGALAVVLGGLLGWWMSRKVVRPVTRVAAAAERVAGGDLHTRITASGDADLRTLAASFNEMVDTVERRIERETRFVADVSHELRSPLTTLVTTTEVMRTGREELTPAGQEAFDLLDAEVHRLHQLVEDLLELGRADAGVADLQLEPVDVGRLVEQVLRRDGRDQSTIPDAPVVARADKRRLERVVANLVENAETHGEGVHRVVVSDHGDRVRLVVEDSGTGIPPEDRDLVFHRFYRGSAAGRRASSGGAGLGLSLVAEHVQLHGGRVWVEDTESGGARFVVELPGSRR
jgi:signal transduction histidine kinase